MNMTLSLYHIFSTEILLEIADFLSDAELLSFAGGIEIFLVIISLSNRERFRYPRMQKTVQ